MATDTMPPCNYGTCWYVINEVQTINQAELDFFKVANVASNARDVDLNTATTWV